MSSLVIVVIILFFGLVVVNVVICVFVMLLLLSVVYYIRQGYTVFTFVCLSVSTQSHRFEWAKWRIVRREKYLTLVKSWHYFHTDKIVLEMSFLLAFWWYSQVQDRMGFRRNVQNFNTYITQKGFTTACCAAMKSWHRPAKGIIHSPLLCCKITWWIYALSEHPLVNL